MKSALALLALAVDLCLAPALIRTATDLTHCSATTASILLNTTLPTVLHRFRIDNGRYPTTSEGLQALLTPPAGLENSWKGPYLKGMVRDPWNTAFIYRPPSSRPGMLFDVISLGRDKVPSRDDLMNEK